MVETAAAADAVAAAVAADPAPAIEMTVREPFVDAKAEMSDEEFHAMAQQLNAVKPTADDGYADAPVMQETRPLTTDDTAEQTFERTYGGAGKQVRLWWWRSKARRQKVCFWVMLAVLVVVLLWLAFR